MRPISVGFPSMKAYMILWEGTEDEERFEIKSCKRGNPYVLAYGKKHYLTEKETKFLRSVLRFK